MLFNISFKNWPNIIYVKYNEEENVFLKNNNTDDNGNNMINLLNKNIDLLVSKIKEHKNKKESYNKSSIYNDKIYLIININSIKKLDLSNTDNMKSYDYIINNIRKYISKIFIIHENKSIVALIKIFIGLKYISIMKMFKYFNNKEEIQEYISKKNKKLELKRQKNIKKLELKKQKDIKKLKSKKNIKKNTKNNISNEL